MKNIINSMLGDKDNIGEDLSREDRIKANLMYDKMQTKLEKTISKIDNTNISITVEGSTIFGTTKRGKQFYFVYNTGMDYRSRVCGSLSIDGETVFTSGTVAKMAEYIVNN